MPTIAEIQSYMDKQAIASITGTIMKLNNPVRGDGQYGPWTIQGGVLKDSTGTHDFNLTDDTILMGQGDVGKTVTFACIPSDRGPVGVKLTIKTKEGKTRKAISVDNRANISFGGNGQSAPAATQTASGASSTAPSGRNTDPVDVRVAAYFRVFDAVCAHNNLDAEAMKQRLMPSDIKEITTGLCMSYRGDYGAYSPPIFRAQQPSRKPQNGASDWPDETTLQSQDPDGIPF